MWRLPAITPGQQQYKEAVNKPDIYTVRGVPKENLEVCLDFLMQVHPNGKDIPSTFGTLEDPQRYLLTRRPDGGKQQAQDPHPSINRARGWGWPGCPARLLTLRAGLAL